jgi:hypothetical protein
VAGGLVWSSTGADAYVPFEPTTQAARELRARLRDKLRGLSAEPDEILHATFSGRLPRGADVENALFYNLNGAGVFNGATVNGLIFEQGPPPASGVRYSYMLAPRGGQLQQWQPTRQLASFHTALTHRAPPRLAEIWWALRTGAGTTTHGLPRRPGEPFSISLELKAPVRHLAPDLLKRLLDGIISGLQHQAGQPPDTMLVSLVADAVGAPGEDVLEALTAPAGAVLGGRPKLLARHGHGVKWNPDDDRCVAATIHLEHAGRWEVTGTAAVVQPRSSPVPPRRPRS